MRYHFDWNTIAGISRALNKSERSLGVTLEEDRDQDQLRTNAMAGLERQREGVRALRWVIVVKSKVLALSISLLPLVYHVMEKETGPVLVLGSAGMRKGYQG